MAAALLEFQKDLEYQHPLDFLEEVSRKNDWLCQRAQDSKITLSVTGTYSTYKMVFIWDEDTETLQCSCFLDLDFSHVGYDTIARALMDLNARLWFGHFIFNEEGHLYYHHTMLLRDVTGNATCEHIQDLVAIAKSETDKYFTLLSLIAEEKTNNRDQLTLAILDCEGVA